MKKPFAVAILLGWLLLGPVAAASAASAGDVPPRPLTDRGLTNLTALTRLIGYVRFFHPGDQVAGLTLADWDALAMAGVERVEAARDPGELAASLSTLFDGIAPTVQVLPFHPSSGASAGFPEVAGAGGSIRWLAWRHEGAGLGAPVGFYKSERVEVGRAPDGGTAKVAQDLDVERLRGHRVRISAAVRSTAGAAGGATLNLHAETSGGSGSAAWRQPIPRGGWRRVEIDAEVPADASLLTLSLDLAGSGRLTFDDVRATADGLDVTGQLINPGLEEVIPGLPPHGWLLSSAPFGAEYSLRPVAGAAAGRWAGELAGPHVRPVRPPLVADLGGGVWALVPVALPADAQGTFPHPSLPPAPPVPDKPAGFVPSGSDRTTRLAGVVVGWGVFQHFYPYFDQVGADWPGALRRGLTATAAGPDEASYVRTLRHLLAELEDGHAMIFDPRVNPPARFAFTWDLVENQLVITSVEPGATHGMVAGDRVLAVDGRPVAAALADLESLTSAATPQWLHLRALAELAGGQPGGTATLSVQPRNGGPVRTVTAAYTAPFGSTLGIGGFGSPIEPRPEKIAQVRPGIYYVDFTRIEDADFYAALDQLAAADGIVFDMRGYPFLLSEVVLKHLIDKPVTTNWFNLPIITRPDGQGWERRSVPFILTPEAPRLTGRVAFLIEGRVLSFAETLMGIVESEHLGALVGGPTAGTNGNMNPFPVAGGYLLRWTGLEVLKTDGSLHHGVGIQPTVPVGRTLAGVLAGRDELLEKGIEVVSRR